MIFVNSSTNNVRDGNVLYSLIDISTFPFQNTVQFRKHLKVVVIGRIIVHATILIYGSNGDIFLFSLSIGFVIVELVGNTEIDAIVFPTYLLHFLIFSVVDLILMYVLKSN